MNTYTEVSISDEVQEITENKIKAITHKVNERLDSIFHGKIKDIQKLQEVCIYSPTSLSIRVWLDIEKKYPGLRALLLNHSK